MQWGFALYFTAMCLSLVHLGDCREHVLPDVRPGLHQEGVLKSFCSHCCWSEQWDWRAAVFSPDDLLDKRSAPLERAQLNQRCCWTPICCCSNCCYWVGFVFFFFSSFFIFQSVLTGGCTQGWLFEDANVALDDTWLSGVLGWMTRFNGTLKCTRKKANLLPLYLIANPWAWLISSEKKYKITKSKEMLKVWGGRFFPLKRARTW